MEMLFFKFHQNPTIYEKFEFFEGGRDGGRGTPFLNLNLDYYWYTYINVPFQISPRSHHNEDFYFLRGRGGARGTPFINFNYYW